MAQGDFSTGLSINYVPPKQTIFDPSSPHVTLLVKILINFNKRMKQLVVDVSPLVFLWDPNLNLTNVTFDLDPCDLSP